MKGSTIVLIVISALVLLISGVVAFNFGSPDSVYNNGSTVGSSRRSASLSNVKQFSIALLIYASDYDDILPAQMGIDRELKNVIMPYVRNNSVFTTLNPNGSLIEENELFAAAPINEVLDASSAVVLFEGNDWPDGDRIVSYLDGHAKFVTGFDRETDLEFDITEVGQKMLDESRAEMEAAAINAAASPPTNSLGMPGG